MSSQYIVGVKLPMEFESQAEAAGYIERCLTNGFQADGKIGSPVVYFRDSQTGRMEAFHDGDGAWYVDETSEHGKVEV